MEPEIQKKVTALLRRPIKCPNEQIPFTDTRIRYPMYASVKYDGFRGVLLNGQLHSPEMKVFGNKQLPDYFHDLFQLAQAHQVVFDCEIWSPSLSFSDLSGVLRAHRGKLDTVEAHIFDVISVSEWNAPVKTVRFIDRYVRLNAFASVLPSNCRIVTQHTCLNPQDAQAKYSAHLSAGCEGIILRSPSGLYKNNRCTHRESNCLKFKHFQTTDATIVSVIQRRRMKDVERTYNPLGLLEKIHTEAAYDLDDAVGAFQVLLGDGKTTAVNLGRGFSYEDRRHLWTQRDTLVGRCVEFKWMPHGSKDLPRIGSVVRFRPDKDL